MHACGRVPIAGVEVKLNGEWLPLKRTVNNQWPYYNTHGPWQSSFPMPIRVTSVTGETIEDTITSAKGGDGAKQFSAVGGSVCLLLLSEQHLSVTPLAASFLCFLLTS